MRAVEFAGVELDATDPERLSRFWTSVLGWTSVTEADGGRVLSSPDAHYAIFLRPAATSKEEQNRIHLDLTSDSETIKQACIERALEAGGSRIDIGQGGASHEVLADPEGNEFCVIEPGNGFLAGTGVIGAVNCDGSASVGHFWSEVLGWPLVWDQDEETAIQSPTGGSKVTWSGPPLMPAPERDRLRLVLRVLDGAGLDVELDRLTALGAVREPDLQDGSSLGMGFVTRVDTSSASSLCDAKLLKHSHFGPVAAWGVSAAQVARAPSPMPRHCCRPGR